MMRKELKEKAKLNLKNNWGQAISLIVLYGLICFGGELVVSIITSIFNLSDNLNSCLTSVSNIIIQSFFLLGTSSFYLKLSRGEEVTYKELFSKTDMFLVTLLALILMGIFETLWALLLIVPGIIAAISYSQTQFILVDNPELDAYDAIKKSKEMMNGHKMDYFVLVLSFAGWGLLSLLTLGIGYLWLIPYMEVTFANFYDSIKA